MPLCCQLPSIWGLRQQHAFPAPSWYYEASHADIVKNNVLDAEHSSLDTKSISPHMIFAELAEAPWQRTWWSQVLGFMHRLDSMDEGSLHPDILSDNIHDALGNPGCCNWAAGIQKQFAILGVPSPFSGSRIRNVDHLAFRKAMLARDMSAWGGLHILPRGAPSRGTRGAKLCTYLRWFAQPDRVNTEPYHELPLPVTKLRSIFHFGWVLIPCWLSRAGLRCLRCHDICAGAPFVLPMLSATSAIMSLTALMFRAFGSSMQKFFRILMMPRNLSCGTTTRSLFVLLYWPLSMRPRQHDRFVLIGLCWLYGRSKFPPCIESRYNQGVSLYTTEKEEVTIRCNHLAGWVTSCSFQPPGSPCLAPCACWTGTPRGFRQTRSLPTIRTATVTQRVLSRAWGI